MSAGAPAPVAGWNKDTPTPVVSAWIMALLTSFAAGLDVGIVSTVGYGVQWLGHAPKKIPTALSQLGVLVLCVGGYLALHPHDPVNQVWIGNVARWSLMALGVGAVAASTRGAPATDSR